MTEQVQMPASSQPPLAGTIIADQQIPGGRQSWFFVPILVIATFGAALAMYSTIGAGMAALLARLSPDNKYVGVALVTAIAGAVQTVVTPLAGRLSDRTGGRFGMRKPWIFWGSIVGLVGTAAVAAFPNLVIIVVAVVVAQAGYAVVLMGQHALLAEQVPTRKRGLVNGFIGVATLLALPMTAMAVSLAPAASWVWFVGPGLVGTVFSLLLVVAFRDRQLTERPAALRWGDVLRSYWVNPRTAPDFTWAWIGRFLMYLGGAPLATFWLYFLTDRVRLDTTEAIALLSRAGLATVLFTAVAGVVAGWISDRLGRRKPVVYVCAVIYIASILTLQLFPSVGGFWVSYGILLGIASGAFGSVVVALQIDVMPSFTDAGKDLGIVTLSGSLPTIVGPLLATVLLSIGQAPNYTAAIIFAVVVFAAAGLCFLPIRGVR